MKSFKKIALLLILCLSFGTTLSFADNDIEENIQTKGPKFVHAERRTSAPIQAQLIATYAASNPFHSAPGYGLHLGYQFSEKFYFGLTGYAYIEGRNINDDVYSYPYDEDDDEKNDRYEHVYGQSGLKESKSELEPGYLLEMRFTPWSHGLYFSFGILAQGKQKSTTTFKAEDRTIGENEYADTGLEAIVEYKEWYGPAAGIGFNYIFKSGLTLGSALSLGIGRNTPDVTVSATTAVSQEDLNYWKKQIQANEKGHPFLVSFSAGYAF